MAQDVEANGRRGPLSLAGADKRNLDLYAGYQALTEMRRSSRGMVVVGVVMVVVVVVSFFVESFLVLCLDSR